VYAQAFDNDGFTVPCSNEIDVLSTAITQVLNNHHIPTHVWLHPSDVNAMKLTKNDNGSYVMPMLFLADGRKFDGLPIIENPRMNKGYFLVVTPIWLSIMPRMALRLRLPMRMRMISLKTLQP